MMNHSPAKNCLGQASWFPCENFSSDNASLVVGGLWSQQPVNMAFSHILVNAKLRCCGRREMLPSWGFYRYLPGLVWFCLHMFTGCEGFFHPLSTDPSPPFSQSVHQTFPLLFLLLCVFHKHSLFVPKCSCVLLEFIMY